MAEDLVQFLRARLDEDEQVARATHSVFLDWEYDEAVKEVRDLGNGNELASVLPQYGAHIARHDPARVLRDIEAKRQIVAAFEAASSTALHAVVGFQAQHGMMAGLSEAVQNIATVYADHPDYREQWRP